MSDCDSEDYSSSEDEDYVPSGGEYSEDDVNELVKEDDDDDDVDEQEGGEKKSSHLPKLSQNKDKKKNKNSLSARKRKKAVLSLDEGQVDKDHDNTEEDSNLGSLDELKKKKIEEAKRKREDDLWSSFLSDVGKPPKCEPTVSVSQNNQKVNEKNKCPNKDSSEPSKEDSERKDDSKKVTITKVFDFAGEEIRVSKEVHCTSREAKAFIKQQEKGQLEPAPSPSRTCAQASSGVKRPVGMSSILGKLGSKKTKMSTLEKSKLDWESFKDQEGIGEELAQHNRGKDGYIERKAFLERVDYRQFELEREIRLKNMKP
ncbi:craniofacial development protein 1 [Engystomops pustulosus]|uniref:craniofacial development protein 1 n=1 Tax=Engystomops pustulosus TaxID=76066 RepID=UPI003AFA1463